MSTKVAPKQKLKRRRLLLTGGRAPATLELARLFHAAGHEVFVAESMREHLCRRSRAVTESFQVPSPRENRPGFITALADILHRKRIDLLIPTCEEVFHVAWGRGALAARSEVFAPSLEQLRVLHSKWEFIQLLEELDFLTPETWLLRAPEDVLDVIGPLAKGERLVFKPVFSRFASKVRFFTAGESPQDLPRPSAQEPWVAQRFIAGTPYCTYGVVREGRLTAHAVYPSHFTAGQGATIHFKAIDHPRIDAWVSRLVSALGYTGQIAFDFIETPEGDLYPLECNPRATSGAHLFRPKDRLDAAFFGEVSESLRPPANRAAMLSLAMGLYGLPSVRSLSRLGEWGKAVATSREILFDWRDPLPALGQVAAMADLWRTSRRHGVSLLEASTWDIEWNGEDA